MQAFARSIVETVRHPLLVLDADHRVVDANAAFYRIFGSSPSATQGRTLFAIDGGRWDIPRLRLLLDKINPDRALDNFELKHDFPGLGHRVMVINARRVCRDDGAAMVLLAIEDVTDSVRAWEALYSLNRELEDRVQQRTGELEVAIRELEAFCYSVSHDLRAPLRAIDGFSDELLRGYSERLDEQGRHYLKRVRAGTQRMGRLIDDLLQLSRFSRGDMKHERVDLTALAHEVEAELRQREPGRHVALNVQPGLNAQGDAGLLKIVLENLLSNAWKFTGKNPSATVSFGLAEHDGRPAFFVRDDGAGFDGTHASKLFGAFQRLHSQEEYPGNGVGLATVRRIIYRHGGQVWAESSPGTGAMFYFTLPEKESHE